MLRLGSIFMLAVVFAGTGFGCAKRSPSRAGGAKVALRLGDEAITVDDIDRRIAPELFELRSQAMRAVLVDRLLQREAQRRSIDLAQLRRLEVEAKVPLPSEAEAMAAVADWVKAGRLKPDEAATIAPSLAAERLHSVRIEQAEEAFYDQLMKQDAVKVDFAALGKPDLDITLDGPTLGPADAPLRIVEFADLAVPFTGIWQTTLEQLVAKYEGKIQFRFKQKPSAPDSDGAKLAEGALCADDQGRYWDFRKALLGNKGITGAAALAPAAAAAKLDAGAFERCLAAGDKKAMVAGNAREAARNRLTGDPVIAVNGILLSGAQDLATIERLLRLESEAL